MSIEIVLLPLAVAAVGAWQARKAVQEGGGHVVAVGTRMRNEALLGRALADTGATVSGTGDELTARWGSTEGRFTRDSGGIWSVHLTGDIDHERAADLVGAVDTRYGRLVQAEVLARLRDRAPGAGLQIESETVEPDDSVTLVLTVGTGT